MSEDTQISISTTTEIVNVDVTETLQPVNLECYFASGSALDTVVNISETVQNIELDITETEAQNVTVDVIYPAGPQGPQGQSLWGTISGTLSAQTDLWKYLSAVGTSNFDITTLNTYLSTNTITLCSTNTRGQILSAGIDLFSIFRTTDSDTQTLTYIPSSYTLSISNGNSVNLSSINTIVAANSANWDTAYNIATVYQGASGNYVLQGGNSTTVPLSVGTNTTQSLILETNNLNRVTILSSGNVGIGNTNPNSRLTVNGTLSVNNNISFLGASNAGPLCYAEGPVTVTSLASNCHVEGYSNTIGGYAALYTHVEGYLNTVNGGSAGTTMQACHVEGYSNTLGGLSNSIQYNACHIGGYLCSIGPASDGVTSGAIIGAYVEGYNSFASNLAAHAEGQFTRAVGFASHAEGGFTQAIGSYSHAEGQSTTARGQTSHAEGFNTQAIGTYSHAEGSYTQAIGGYSHAAGYRASAAQNYTYAWSDGNLGTLTQNISTTRAGQYMVSASGGIFIPGKVGIGIDSYSTALSSNTLIVNGDTYINNNLTVNGNISAAGTATFYNTVFSVTSALCAIANSSQPALYVGQLGTGDLASFYDLNPIPVEVLHVGGSVGIPGVGIYTSVPNKALTVVGEISATSDITTSGTIYTTSGNSNNWNTAYSVSTAYQNTSGSFAIKGVYLPLSGGQITGFVTSTSSISAANTITSLNLATNNQVQYLSSGVVKVFQYYNTSTNSLDTVFN